MARRATGAVGLALSLALVAPVSAVAQPSLTIKPDDTTLEPGRALEVSGMLRAPEGQPLGGRTVTLLEDRFPFGEFETSQTNLTNEAGRYRFRRLKPAVNTRYRTRVADSDLAVDSRRLSVIPEPVPDFGITGQNERFVTARVRYILPRSPSSDAFSGRRVQFYFRKVSQPRFVFKERAPTRLRFRGRQVEVAATGQIKLPPGEYRFQVSFCIPPPRGGFPVGKGALGPPPLQTCPRSFPPEDLGRTLNARGHPHLRFAGALAP